VEGKLNTQNQQLSELIATKDKFFSIIAHDLKNPFNVLIGTSEQLLSNYSDQESTKVLKMVTNIHEVSKQAYSLLENLLIWSKIQSGKLVPQTQKIDISNLIYEVCRSMINIARQKNIEIETDLESDNIICADPDMIMTVLRNLLSNAIKFTYQNGQIFIKCLTIENSIEFHVKDSGTGIESEHLEKLFGIESKLSKPGTANETGTGLGLILCKEFVEMHGGRIWVESEVGCGSDFRFTIPYV